MDHERYLIGMDGGGTATKICITGMDGRVQSRFKTGAININGQSLAEFQKTMDGILAGVTGAGYRPEDCAGAGIGAAGLSNPRQKELLVDGMRARGFTAPLYTYRDDETALASAFPACHGVILIAGTGSVCLGLTASGRRARSGGYGYLIDDSGSAYALASDILRAVIRGEDGRGEPTVLRDMVLTTLHIDEPEGIVGFLYDPARTKGEIAALATLLPQAIEMGDKAALAIEKTAIEELYLLIDAVLRRLPEEKDIAFAGSVLQKNARIREGLTQRILTVRPEAHVAPPVEDAAIGAIRLLQRDLSMGSIGKR